MNIKWIKYTITLQDIHYKCKMRFLTKNERWLVCNKNLRCLIYRLFHIKKKNKFSVFIATKTFQFLEK